MRDSLIVLFAVMSMHTACNMPENPLLSDWNTPFQSPPFDLIKNGHYLPAFETLITDAKKQIDAITNTVAPDFENTVVALETCNKRLKLAGNIFFNLNAAETCDEMQAIAQKVSPLLTSFQNDLYLNEKLFANLKRVKETATALDTEQQRLLDETYTDFVRNGANLSDSDKATFRELSTRLALLSLDFEQNLLAETNTFILHLVDKNDLAGLPQNICDAAAAEAAERQLDGWAFTLHQPSYSPFLKYADNRALREKIYRANNSKATVGKKSNLDAIRQLTDLRLQLAQLLGYKSYADFRLEHTMAKNTAAVNALLDSLLVAAKPVAEAELAAVQEYARSLGADFKLMPWDLSYYAEKLRDAKFACNDELTRPYFRLENVIDGAFQLANRLYGLEFEPLADVPVYHPDVQTCKVTDADGRFMALLYLDFFPRAGKNSGAWMTVFREQSNIGGENLRPLVSLVCNFSKPVDSVPALLTFSEVETFLHEFGHGLHGILSDVAYPSLAGTNVYHDFVELPSQIMENFCVEKDFLDLFARHYLTNEKIPAELVAKIVASRNFMEGYACVRQLNFGRLDLAYHTLTSPLTGDIKTFERNATAETAVLPEVDTDLISASFAHIFAGEYAAGYYGYKWAETLDADAFSVFKQHGIFDPATAASFRENILSKGGSDDPMTLYVKFRGQAPSIDALLIRSGLKQ